MTEVAVHPGRRLGRRPPKGAPSLDLGRFLTGIVPQHPAAADHLSRVPAWMLGANDSFGTCGPTCIANLVVLTWLYLLGESVSVSDDAIFDLYRRSGNPGFDPATGADDNGVDMQTMLEALLAGGIEITHDDDRTEVVKPLAFAAVDHSSLDEVRAATSIIGAVSFGLDLEVAQQTQTDAGLWDFYSSAAWGGHATCGGRYRGAGGVHADDVDLVTWAEVVGTTDAFLSHQLAECWVVIWPAHLQHPDFQAGVDLGALAGDYTALTGRPFPAVAPPAPGPAPVPGGPAIPVPPPAVVHWLRAQALHQHGAVRSWIEAVLAAVTGP